MISSNSFFCNFFMYKKILNTMMHKSCVFQFKTGYFIVVRFLPLLLATHHHPRKLDDKPSLHTIISHDLSSVPPIVTKWIGTGQQLHKSPYELLESMSCDHCQSPIPSAQHQPTTNGGIHHQSAEITINTQHQPTTNGGIHLQSAEIAIHHPTKL